MRSIRRLSGVLCLALTLAGPPATAGEECEIPLLDAEAESLKDFASAAAEDAGERPGPSAPSSQPAPMWSGISATQLRFDGWRYTFDHNAPGRQIVAIIAGGQLFPPTRKSFGSHSRIIVVLRLANGCHVFMQGSIKDSGAQWEYVRSPF